MNGLIEYFSENLGWDIDLSDFEDIEDISYDFSAADIGLKEEAFAKISSLRQLQPMTGDQKWGIFCIEFDSSRFEVGGDCALSNEPTTRGVPGGRIVR